MDFSSYNLLDLHPISLFLSLFLGEKSRDFLKFITSWRRLNDFAQIARAHAHTHTYTPLVCVFVAFMNYRLTMGLSFLH